MCGYKADLLVLEVLLREVCPRFMELVDASDMPNPLTVLAASWLLCAYTTSFPTETAFRVLDALIFIGPAVLVLTAVAMVSLHIDKLLECEDLLDAAELLKHYGEAMFNPDILMDEVRMLAERITITRVEELRLRFCIDQHQRSIEHMTVRGRERLRWIAKGMNHDSATKLIAGFDAAAAVERGRPPDYRYVTFGQCSDILATLTATFGNFSNDRATKVFLAFDWDASGTLDLREFISCAAILYCVGAGCEAGDPDEAARQKCSSNSSGDWLISLWFRAFDFDMSGTLDRNECRHLLESVLGLRRSSDDGITSETSSVNKLVTELFHGQSSQQLSEQDMHTVLDAHDIRTALLSWFEK